jgi:hypothetical protein
MSTAESYPRLAPDSPDASRTTNADVAHYVGLEEVGRGYPEDFAKFIRSAACDGFNVWLWSCKSEKGEIYVYAEADARRFGLGSLTTRFDSTATMTPEQYLKYLGYWPTRRKVRRS